MSHTILFATDLHGHALSYEELFAKAAAAQASAIVLGGDLCPHSPLPGQETFLRAWLGPRLRRFAQEHKESRVFGLLGNDDWGILRRELESWERQGSFYCLHQRAHNITNELWIAGSSFVPVTPFGMSDFDRFEAPGWKPPAKLHPPLFSVERAGAVEIVEGSIEELKRRETLEKCLAALARLSPPARTVYVFHAPPAQTALDQIGPGVHVGSAAIRRFIEKHQPPLTLHGHIHESPRVSGSIADAIGKTQVLNPGDSQAQLRALRINFEGTRAEWEALF